MVAAIRERGRIVEGFDMGDVTYPIGDVPEGACLWCGKKKGRRRKFCSGACSVFAERWRSTGRRSQRPKIKECMSCGNTYDVPRTGPVGDYCSVRCKHRDYYLKNPDKLEERRRKGRERAAAKVRAKGPLPRCACCGDELASRRLTFKYCSKPECKSVGDREYRARQPLCSIGGCEKRVQAKGLCGSHYAVQWARLNRDKSRSGKQRYRAVKRDAFVDDIDYSVVFERDKWICGICGERIPKRAKYPDLMSASLDHVVPLSKGGKHSYANVQAAHFGCNSVKRDGGQGEQLALI